MKPRRTIWGSETGVGGASHRRQHDTGPSASSGRRNEPRTIVSHDLPRTDISKDNPLGSDRCPIADRDACQDRSATTDPGPAPDVLAMICATDMDIRPKLAWILEDDGRSIEDRAAGLQEYILSERGVDPFSTTDQRPDDGAIRIEGLSSNGLMDFRRPGSRRRWSCTVARAGACKAFKRVIRSEAPLTRRQLPPF